MIDGSGELPFFVLTMIVGAVIGFGITVAVDYFDDREIFNGSVDAGWYIGATVVGAAVGTVAGMVISYSATGTLSADIRWISAFNRAAKGDYSKLLKLSTKNPDSKYVSVGRYFNKKSPPNYINIAKKNKFTYFDMGKNYGIADKKGIAQTINRMFIEEQHSLGKIFYKTSMNIGNGAYKMELEMLAALGSIVLPF